MMLANRRDRQLKLLLPAALFILAVPAQAQLREWPNPAGRNVISELYQRMDVLVGRTLAKCKGKDTVLTGISAHGFSTFRRGIDLNRWLEANGYLSLQKGPGGKDNAARHAG